MRQISMQKHREIHFAFRIVFCILISRISHCFLHINFTHITPGKIILFDEIKKLKEKTIYTSICMACLLAVKNSKKET